jgi:hypothetical protein
MALQDYLELLPEEKRDAFKQEIQGFFPVSEIAKHPEFQRQLSIKHDTTMANWQKDKLPAIVEEEVKKRTTKDPIQLELEKLRAEIAAKDQQAILKDRKAQATGELAKLGLNPEFADLLVHPDETVFGERLTKFTSEIKGLVDSNIKKVKAEVFSQRPEGNRQSDPNKQITRSAFDNMSFPERAAAMKNGAEIVEG